MVCPLCHYYPDTHSFTFHCQGLFPSKLITSYNLRDVRPTATMGLLYQSALVLAEAYVRKQICLLNLSELKNFRKANLQQTFLYSSFRLIAGMSVRYGANLPIPFKFSKDNCEPLFLLFGYHYNLARVEADTLPHHIQTNFPILVSVLIIWWSNLMVNEHDKKNLALQNTVAIANELYDNRITVYGYMTDKKITKANPGNPTTISHFDLLVKVEVQNLNSTTLISDFIPASTFAESDYVDPKEYFHKGYDEFKTEVSSVKVVRLETFLEKFLFSENNIYPKFTKHLIEYLKLAQGGYTAVRELFVPQEEHRKKSCCFPDVNSAVAKFMELTKEGRDRELEGIKSYLVFKEVDPDAKKKRAADKDGDSEVQVIDPPVPSSSKKAVPSVSSTSTAQGANAAAGIASSKDTPIPNASSKAPPSGNAAGDLAAIGNTDASNKEASAAGMSSQEREQQNDTEEATSGKKPRKKYARKEGEPRTPKTPKEASNKPKKSKKGKKSNQADATHGKGTQDDPVDLTREDLREKFIIDLKTINPYSLLPVWDGYYSPLLNVLMWFTPKSKMNPNCRRVCLHLQLSADIFCAIVEKLIMSIRRQSEMCALNLLVMDKSLQLPKESLKDYISRVSKVLMQTQSGRDYLLDQISEIFDDGGEELGVTVQLIEKLGKFLFTLDDHDIVKVNSVANPFEFPLIDEGKDFDEIPISRILRDSVGNIGMDETDGKRGTAGSDDGDTDFLGDVAADILADNVAGLKRGQNDDDASDQVEDQPNKKQKSGVDVDDNPMEQFHA